MNVSVTVTLTVPAAAKHWRQMQSAAEFLTDSKDSVQVSACADSPKKLRACFAVPKARQEDIVDRIGRAFWNVEDYSDSTLGFGSEPRRRKRSWRKPPRVAP